jgi:tetratricopeptide (TPR) repeat protein
MTTSLNPGNPNIKFSIAEVYLSIQNNKNAKEFLKQALELKPDYIDAYLMFSQVSKNEGNMNDAIRYAEVALSLAPGSKDLTAYLESLQNGSKNVALPSSTTTSTSPTPKTPTKK